MAYLEHLLAMLSLPQPQTRSWQYELQNTKLLLRSHVSLIAYAFKYKTVMQVEAAFILAYVIFAERERKISKGFFELQQSISKT